jgi:sulfur carrier protein ThiS
MDVHVRLGPGLVQRVGPPRLTLSLPTGATVQDALGSLRETYPDLLVNSDSLLTVVDGAPVSDQHILRSGAELALLFPVSGGSIQIDQEGSPWPSRFKRRTKPSS